MVYFLNTACEKLLNLKSIIWIVTVDANRWFEEADFPKMEILLKNTFTFFSWTTRLPIKSGIGKTLNYNIRWQTRKFCARNVSLNSKPTESLQLIKSQSKIYQWRTANRMINRASLKLLQWNWEWFKRPQWENALNI